MVPLYRMARCLPQERLSQSAGRGSTPQRPKELLHACGVGHLLRATWPGGGGAQGAPGYARAETELRSGRARVTWAVDRAGSRGAVDGRASQGGALSIPESGWSESPRRIGTV